MNFFQRYKLKGLQKKVQKLFGLRDQRGSNADVSNEIAAQYALAKFYEQHQYDKNLPHASTFALECYRVAAVLGDVKAQFTCGERLLDQAKFWDNWSHNPLYGRSIHKKYASNLYEEAFAYLREAESHDNPFAKRLLGLCHIHGWGVPKNMDEGFRLVLDSIEQEKAWDRATQIFDQLKLNSPQFFAALRSYKGQPM